MGRADSGETAIDHARGQHELRDRRDAYLSIVCSSVFFCDPLSVHLRRAIHPRFGAQRVLLHVVLQLKRGEENNGVSLVQLRKFKEVDLAVVVSVWGMPRESPRVRSAAAAAHWSNSVIAR